MHRFSFQVSENVNDLIAKSQTTFVEPLKKLSNVFSGLASAIQTHEQAVQEWKTIAARVSSSMRYKAYIPEYGTCRF